MISFAPLTPDAVRFLMDRTGIDFSHCDFAAPQWLCVTANKDGVIQGVLIAEFTTWFECHLTLAVDDFTCISRRLLEVIFATLFSQAVRITAQVRPDNQQANRSVRRLGFQFEGFQRFAIEGRWDANLYGMLANECRYLKRIRKKHEIAKAA
jgi:hypothetical protein